MAEAVRLVIWDLDETFWKGTVTEGGITEYVQAHHDVVIALARRGIVSSICSKNDHEPILRILQEKGIADYFVFPSINWETKGPRLASLIETIQLRPATVMFIDDNPGNRGEAARFVPDLQIEDEHFIARLLDDPRFKGKDDEGLSRLAQYKLLEQRKQDERCASGDNEEFLRSCDIRVHIEYDVLPHIDRVIELINRTNQLNFTKLRLTEDAEQAREQLTRFFTSHWHQSGLVRVADKYGDYGFVGFFMVRNGLIDVEGARLTPILLHYCFSCRTLGMQIETWLYRYLKQPRLTVKGDVLTDIFTDRDIDWIRLVSSMDECTAPIPRLAPEIRLHGGCDITSVGHYLNASSDSMVVTGNFHAGVGFVRLNGASLLLSACDRRNALFREEAAALRIPYEMMVSNYFDDARAGTAFVFGGQYDCYGPGRWRHHRYRHKKHGWEIRIEPEVLKIPDLTLASPELIAQRAEEAAATPEKKADAGAMAAHVRMHYESIDPPSDADLKRSMEEIFARLPVGSKLVVMLDHNQMRMANGSLQDQPWVDHYNMMIRSIAAPYPFVAVVCYSEFIRSEDEIRSGGNHYDRAVYKRMSEAILGALQELPTKDIHVRSPSAPASPSKPLTAIETGSGRMPGPWPDVSTIIAAKTNPCVLGHVVVDRPELRIEHFRNRAKTSSVVFTFGDRAYRDPGGQGFVTERLLKNGMDVVAIETSSDAGGRNLLDHDIAEIERWLSWTSTPYRLRLGYGSGRDACAAIRFSNILRLHRVVALTPPFRSELPGERSGKDDPPLLPHCGGIFPTPGEAGFVEIARHVPNQCDYMVIFDPKGCDVEYIRRLQHVVTPERLKLMAVPYAGQYLLDLGILAELALIALSEGRFTTIAEARRQVTARSTVHLFRLAEHCLSRGHLRWALAINRRMATSTDSRECQLQASEILRRLGRFDEAIAALDGLLGEPDPIIHANI